MKQNFYYFTALLLIFLVFSSKASARFMPTTKGQAGVQLQEMASKDSLEQMEERESIDQLMGTEVCENEDEECFKRRLISEAHLDYIYTQHRKP